MKNPLVQYVLHPHTGKPVACFVALIHPDDGEIHIGWSQCRAGEHFNMKRGREIATGRALKGTKDKPCPYRFFRVDGSYEWINTVQQELDLFRLSAMNYFSHKLHVDSDRRVSDIQLSFIVVPDYRSGEASSQQPAASPVADLTTHALEFYANPANWRDIETGIRCFPGPAIDGGATAREALGLVH